MPQSHLFVVDPLDSLNLALDSSLRLALSLAQMGHKVFACQMNDIQWNSRHVQADAAVQRIVFNGPARSAQFVPHRLESLAYFSAIHMRKDPPFDLEYIACTWLLESVAGKTKIYNQPSALRSLNEKLAIFNFPEAIRPALVSTQPSVLLDFIKTRCDGDAVIKPLNQYGGRGVRRITLGSPEFKTDQAVLDSLLAETEGGHHLRLVQAFDKAIFGGEVRAFYVGGLPLAWCLKKPAPGEFLANTRAGATLHHYTPKAIERERAGAVAVKLRESGVEIVGFDLLGGFVSEINLTSPRLLHAAEDTTPYYQQWAEWCAKDCKI